MNRDYAATHGDVADATPNPDDVADDGADDDADVANATDEDAPPVLSAAPPELDPEPEQSDDERLDQRFDQLPDDLRARLQTGLSLDDAEEIAIKREQRLQIWVAEVRRALNVLDGLAGYPVPAGITSNLTEGEQAKLTLVLAALPAEEQSYDR